MAEGFKLLDAYVEVTASGKGLAAKVAQEIHAESAGHLGRTGGTMGDQLAGGFSSAVGRSHLGGSVTKSVEEGASPEHLNTVGSRMGGGLFKGLGSVISAGAVGGLVGGLTSSVASGIVGIVGGAVSDIEGMLTTVGGMIASTVIDFNSELQNADIGFTTMLGSAAKSKAFLGDLQDFAKSTPFEFTNLVHNAQNMMGMGIAAKNVIPDLRALGDSVASIGGSASQVDSVTLAFDQMYAKGTLDMGNMNQLMQNGVPSALKIMAAAYHVTTGQMITNISTGKVQASVALPALIKGIEKGTKATAALGGMMDKQSTTFTGALSNIQDGLTQTTAKAFKPFFDIASSGMQRFASALSGKPAEKFQKDITKAIKPLAKSIGDWFKTVDIGKIFKEGGKALTGFFKSFKPKDVIKGLQDFAKAGGDIAKMLLPLFPKAVKLIHDFLPVAVGITKWAVDTAKAFKHGADQIHDAFVIQGKGIGVLAGQMRHGWDQITGFVSGAVKNFQHGGDQLNHFFSGVAGFFKDLVGSFARGWGQITGALGNAVGAFKHGADQILGFFTGLPGALATVGTQMVSGLVGGLRDAWGALTSTIHDLAMQLPEPIRKALDIHSPSRVFHKIGQQVAQGLHLGLLGSVDQIKTASGNLADAVLAGFHGPNVARNIAHIHTVAKALERLSAARDRAMGRLSTAQGNLDSVLSARSDFAANVKANVMGNADTTSLYGTIRQDAIDKRQAVLDANATARTTYADAVAAAKDAASQAVAPVTRGAALTKLNGVAYQPSWTSTVAGTPGASTAVAALKLQAVPKSPTSHSILTAMKANLKKLLADTKKFASNLRRLQFNGIDPATYDELVQAGVRGGGLETSNAFLSDPAMARSIFSLERQIGKAGGKLGTATANAEFHGQVTKARAAVAKAQHEVTHINVQMVVEAKKIDEVDKLLHMITNVKHTARKKKKKH